MLLSVRGVLLRALARAGGGLGQTGGGGERGYGWRAAAEAQITVVAIAGIRHGGRLLEIGN